MPPRPAGAYPLSLHDALPISAPGGGGGGPGGRSTGAAPIRVSLPVTAATAAARSRASAPARSEEHTSELQSLAYLVCRRLLEKKNLPAVRPRRRRARVLRRVRLLVRGHRSACPQGPPAPTLFPYTTLFRSRRREVAAAVRGAGARARRRSGFRCRSRQPRRPPGRAPARRRDRKSTRLNSSH